MKVVVTEKAVREYISELMSGPGWGAERAMNPSPVVTSAVVDPSAALTNPENDRFKPRNRVELKAALSTIIDKTQDDDANDLFIAVKDAVQDQEEEKEMKKEKTTENAIRAAVRKMLREAGLGSDPDEIRKLYGDKIQKVDPGVHGTEYMRSLEKRKSDLRSTLEKSTFGDEEDQASRVGQPAPGRMRTNLMQTDVGGASFKELAKEFGFAAESGAKAAVERAVKKAKFLFKMDPDDLEILTLTAVNDYIDILKNTGEITATDVKLLRNNPGIVSSLDGFREYYDSILKKVQKEDMTVSTAKP